MPDRLEEVKQFNTQCQSYVTSIYYEMIFTSDNNLVIVHIICKSSNHKINSKCYLLVSFINVHNEHVNKRHFT